THGARQRSIRDKLPVVRGGRQVGRELPEPDLRVGIEQAEPGRGGLLQQLHAGAARARHALDHGTGGVEQHDDVRLPLQSGPVGSRSGLASVWSGRPKPSAAHTSWPSATTMKSRNSSAAAYRISSTQGAPRSTNGKSATIVACSAYIGTRSIGGVVPLKAAMS